MKVILLVAAILGHSLAFNRPSIKITNGEDAARGQFPYQVSMQWGVLGIWQHICGASIIAENVVVTAGHCITETPGIGSFRVIAGIVDLNEEVSTKQVISVSSSVVHPDYDGGVNTNDIAILKLSGSFSWNSDVQAIQLPASGEIFSGQVVLSGWGSISTGSVPSMPNHLQTVQLPLLTHEECSAALIDMMGETDPYDEVSNVCTGPLTGAISACSGDSGGPLAQDGVLVGIVSWGFTPCGSEGAPSVYTRASSFIEFINNNS